MALQKQNAVLKFTDWPGNLIPDVDPTNEPDALMARVIEQEY